MQGCDLQCLISALFCPLLGTVYIYLAEVLDEISQHRGWHISGSNKGFTHWASGQIEKLDVNSKNTQTTTCQVLYTAIKENWHLKR